MQLIQNGSPNSPTMPVKRPTGGMPGYANNNPGVQQPTVLDGDVVNTVLAEIIAVLTAASMSPDPANNAQLLAALRVVFGAKASNNTWTGSNTWSGGGTFNTATVTFNSNITSHGTNNWSGQNNFGVVTVPAATTNAEPVNLGQFVASAVGSLFYKISPTGVIDATYGTTVPIAAGLTTTTVTIPVTFNTFMEQPLVCWDGITPPLGASVSAIPGGSLGPGVTTVVVTTNGTTGGSAGVVIRVRGF